MSGSEGHASRQPRAAVVVQRLREKVSGGDWAVGERIPKEAELMELLGVSRGTLREGVKALAHAGMLEVRQGDGTYVRARSELEGTARRSVREHTAAHVFEVRQVLDTQAARLASERATADGVHELQRLLDAALAAWNAGDVEAWADLDWEFHRGVARLSDNPLLEELYSGFAGAFKRDLMNQSVHPDFDPSLQPGHQDLIAAIASGDPETAEHSVRCGLEIAESRS
ncbi:FadR/GntR family transcriptional regulator [Arthrobacter sp. NPDC090010]|uniref:FadR/GntR family transcriptional regulator n=1 Tax=Arthrobacter sp. NPDC090010 TaxID=3363942 RepID=UPI00380D70BE